ncbi:MAG: hypothetical protein KDK99_21220, partial [Verrucomicrobiales bacterium]|nr:hypothetical protein [Verrucomicrobiales bacterium]
MRTSDFNAPDSEPAVDFPLRGLRVAGKFLENAAGEKVRLDGVTYGPFPPSVGGRMYPERERMEADLDQMVELGLNAIRLYEPPPQDLLDAAWERGLGVMAGLAWTDHVDFLGEPDLVETAWELGVEQARALRHPAVVAVVVGNEVEKTLVRWMGPLRVRRFLEEMIHRVRAELEPEVLVSYATYPSTEYLMPRNVDFFGVNLYLEEEAALRSYLQRLQHRAGDRPLVVTEFGLDVARHGEAAQAEVARWWREALLDAGVAG